MTSCPDARGRRRLLSLATLGAGLVLAGCGADRPKPTPLESVTPQIGARALWQTRLGAVNFPLSVAARADQVILATSDGTVVALQSGDGREIWRGSVGGSITAGVGSDGRFAAVVTAANELRVLDRGRASWSTALASRAVTCMRRHMSTVAAVTEPCRCFTPFGSAVVPDV